MTRGEVNNDRSAEELAREDHLIELAKALDQQISEGNCDFSLEDSTSRLSSQELEELHRAREMLTFLDQARHGIANRPASESVALGSDSTLVNVPREKLDRDTDSPKRIGRFEIREVIGEGGFARVFLARDPDLDRLVALKVPLPSKLSDENSRKRFERESRAAAVLNHPAIVPIFETGTTEPIAYIAFAFCPGMNLSQWFGVQFRDVTPTVAAALVARLAEAVEHAHQRGIIHRDLKPANILLENVTDDFTPEATKNGATALANRLRITDFGLARLDSADDPTLTLDGAVVGTPAYMSPEQARSDRDIGPATDIFSLGTILYELLTGDRPFQGDSHLATLRKIESDEPRSPGLVKSSVPKDLASICMKCLRKSPDERYQSAYELSADLERWLNDIPVHARPATAWEKFASWRKRNPRLAVAVSCAALATVLGLAGTTWQWRKATINFESARTSAQEEKRARENAEKVAAFLGRIYRSPDPKREGRDVRLADVLANSIDEVQSEFADQPETRWTLLMNLAKSYISLGLDKQGTKLLRQIESEQREAAADPSPTSVTVLRDLAERLLTHENYEEAAQLLDRAELAIEEVPGDNRYSICQLQCSRAFSLAVSGDHEAAIPMYREAIGGMNDCEAADPKELLQMKYRLAMALRITEQFEEAIALLTETIDRLDELFGPDHITALMVRNELLNCRQAQGQTQDVVQLRKEIYESTSRLMGTEHPQTLMTMSNYATTLSETGDPQSAVALLTECVERSESTFGKSHPGTMMSVYQLGNAKKRLADWAEAETHYERALEGFRPTVGLLHRHVASLCNNLGEVYSRQRKWEAVARICEERANAYEKRDGRNAYDAVLFRALAGIHTIFAGDVEAGLPLTKEYLATTDQGTDPARRRPLVRARFHLKLAAALVSQSEFESAAPHAQHYVEFVANPPAQTYDEENPKLKHEADVLLSHLLQAAVHSEMASVHLDQAAILATESIELPGGLSVMAEILLAQLDALAKDSESLAAAADKITAIRSHAQIGGATQ